MNRDKQIEEKRDLIDILYMSGYGLYRGDCNDIAKQIQEQGYRKASEVAMEIFGEIEASAKVKYWRGGGLVVFEIDGEDFANLKKKYIGEDTNRKRG